MVNKKALSMVAAALVTVLILSSLAVMRTTRSEGQTQANPDIIIFLKINGILGESADALHKDWIDIDAFNWSEAMASITSIVAGRAAARIDMTDFQFEMKTNKASPLLFLACATGKHITYATLDVCKPSETSPIVFLRFNFTSVTITSYNIAGSTPLDRPVEQVSIAFGKITMTYWQFDEANNIVGVITAYYDLIAGKGGLI